MVLRAVVGAVGFLSRVPVGQDRDAWVAFRESPVTFPLAGYLLGGLLAGPIVVATGLNLPAPVVGGVYIVAVYATTGIAHVDGLADLGDAAAVHGDPDRRRTAMVDPSVGAGGVLSVAVVISVLALGGVALGALPPLHAGALVVIAEVSAKLGMAVLACVGHPAHDGMGADLLVRADRWTLVGPVLVALPVMALAWPSAAGAGALVAGVATGFVLHRWASDTLGGANGDVFGATNEIARAIALTVGVVAWTQV